MTMTETKVVAVVTDDSLPDKLMLEGIDVSFEPRFSVAEVAKVFFGRSPHWLRWVERKGRIKFDGEPVSVSRTEVGARTYTLADVEKMAHGLAATGAIEPVNLIYALRIVQSVARVYGYLPPGYEAIKFQESVQEPDETA